MKMTNAYRVRALLSFPFHEFYVTILLLVPHRFCSGGNLQQYSNCHLHVGFYDARVDRVVYASATLKSLHEF